MERMSERERFNRHLERASGIIDGWSQWKRDVAERIMGRQLCPPRPQDDPRQFDILVLSSECRNYTIVRDNAHHYRD